MYKGIFDFIDIYTVACLRKNVILNIEKTMQISLTIHSVH